MPEPTWCDDIRPWEFAGMDVHEAMRAHPAFKGKERIPFVTYGEGFLAAAWDGVTFEIRGSRWWGPDTQVFARMLADDLVQGLRERIREAKRAARASGGSKQAR